MAYLDHLSHDALLKTLTLKRCMLWHKSPRDIAKILHKSKSCLSTGCNSRLLPTANLKRLIASLYFKLHVWQMNTQTLLELFFPHVIPNFSPFQRNNTVFQWTCFTWYGITKTKGTFYADRYSAHRQQNELQISRTRGIIILNYECYILSGFRIICACAEYLQFN